ncbi:MAG: hypothetical protein FD137_1063 [Spirochaetes bacterium]|nr:MAG: hypothetical protein FD137_1063 [Spirochaetota bacterium]
MDVLEGAYDLHVHSGPDLLPRKFDDMDLAQRIVAAKMGGYAIKSHYFCTAERAALIRKLYPACDAVGTVTLNNAVGGINPNAVEMAARAGAKLVWLPTADSEWERREFFGGRESKKLPYMALIVSQLEDEGVRSPPISILKDGKLTESMRDVLDVIAKKEMILATSHISHQECFAVIKEAHARGVKRIVVTHVEFPTTAYSIDEQRELAKYGALMEHCFATWASGKVDLAVAIEQIKALGHERVLLSSDLGQPGLPFPDEGLAIYAQKLLDAGLSEGAVQTMCFTNPRALLGIQ